ncbi:MAG: hypothetical protein ACKVRN_09565 [Pyrinomonadaceae bacterium]
MPSISGRMNFSWVSMSMLKWRQKGAAFMRQLQGFWITGNDSGTRALAGSMAMMSREREKFR